MKERGRDLFDMSTAVYLRSVCISSGSGAKTYSVGSWKCVFTFGELLLLSCQHLGQMNGCLHAASTLHSDIAQTPHLLGTFSVQCWNVSCDIWVMSAGQAQKDMHQAWM